MTCPKSLGPSLHAQPEPCERLVSLGIASMDITSSSSSVIRGPRTADRTAH